MLMLLVFYLLFEVVHFQKVPLPLSPLPLSRVATLRIDDPCRPHPYSPSDHHIDERIAQGQA